MLDIDALPHPATLIDLLEWRAGRDANRTAYAFVGDEAQEEISLTFAGLGRRARAIAGRLQSLGQVGDRVLVLCPAGLEYTAATFGCFYGGFVAVPAYASDVPGEAARLGDVVRDSGARLGLTTRALLPHLLQAADLGRLRWVVADDTPLDLADAWRRPSIDAESLAILLYTSGSTSRPKGVMFTHGNLVHPAHSLRSLLSDDENQRMVVASPPHVSDSIRTGILYPLCACVPVTFIAPEAVAERPARWLETISRLRGTTSFAPNFLFDLSVRSIPPESRSALDLSCLHYLRNSGESVRADTVARFEAYFAPCGLRPGTVRSAYGLSEARGIAQSLPGTPLVVRSFDRARLQHGEVTELPHDAESGRMLVGQGPPSTGQRVEIVDPQTLKRCESDRVGEIWTSGPHVAQGYWRLPEETRAAFDAHLADTGEGPFFRTGDLGFLHEGELFITGRLKEIIIIRGRNLYPVDLEASLQDCHPALASYAAAAFAIDVGDQEQLAIVHEVDPALAAGEHEAIISAIRQRVSAHHGVQARTVALVQPGSIPRIGPGKLGRAACRARLLAGTLPVLRQDVLDPTSARRHGSYQAPRTPIERTLAGIWEAALEVERVGIHDEFADLGGDSLLSMQVLLGITEAGLPVTTEDIYRHGTIAALAAAIDARQAEPIQDGEPVVGFIPLNGNQLWLLEHGELAAAWAVETSLLTQRASDDPPLDAALLEKAAQQLVFQHDALRLRCRETAAGWRAEYVAHTPLGLVSFLDLSHLPPEERRTRVAEEIVRVRESIDVQRGLLLRIGLINLGDARDLVAVCVHHVITDLLSTQILIRDLDSLYSQLARGKQPALPPRTATINQWLQHATAFARSDAGRREAAYWSGVVAHRPTILPIDFPERERIRGSEQVVAVRLGQEQTTALREVRQRGVSVPDTVHYALARALSEEVGAPGVLFRTSSHSRSPLLDGFDFSRTAGFLATDFPVLLEVNQAAGHLEGARAIRTQMQAIPHQGVGFQVLQDYADETLRAALVSDEEEAPILLNYWGDIDRVYDGLASFRLATEWDAELEATEQGNTQVPWNPRIEITASIAGGRLLLWVTYHDRAYRAETIERFAHRMLEILTELADGVPGPQEDRRRRR